MHTCKRTIESSAKVLLITIICLTFVFQLKQTIKDSAAEQAWRLGSSQVIVPETSGEESYPAIRSALEEESSTFSPSLPPTLEGIKPPLMFENINLLPYWEGLEFSSFYCVNRFTWSNQMQCVLRNVGLLQNGSVVVHLSPNDSRSLTDLEEVLRPSIVGQFNLQVLLSHDPIVPKKTYLTRITDKPVTIAAPDSTTGLKCSLALQPGHDFDDIWTTWNGLTTVGSLGTEGLLVIGPECPAASKFWSTIYPNVLVLSETRLPGNATLIGNLHIAAPKAEWITFPTLESGFIARYFRDRSLVLHGVRVKRNGTFRIAVRKKNSKHAIANTDEVMSHLRRKYPHAVVELLLPQYMTDKEEIEYISGLDVYLTPPGGGSYSSHFLPDRATAIYVDACWPGTANRTLYAKGVEEHNGSYGAATQVYCFSLDSVCWDQMPHYFKQYVGARDVDQIVYDGRNQDPAMRNQFSILSYSVKVDLGELEMLIEEAMAKKNAFDSVGVYDHEGDSFDDGEGMDDADDDLGDDGSTVESDSDHAKIAERADATDEIGAVGVDATTNDTTMDEDGKLNEPDNDGDAEDDGKDDNIFNPDEDDAGKATRERIAATKRWAFDNLDLWKQVRRASLDRRRRLREEDSISGTGSGDGKNEVDDTRQPTTVRPTTPADFEGQVSEIDPSRLVVPGIESDAVTSRPTRTTKEGGKTTSPTPRKDSRREKRKRTPSPFTASPTATRAPLAEPLRRVKRGKDPEDLKGRWSWHMCQNGDHVQYLRVMKEKERTPIDWSVRQCVLADVELTAAGRLVYHLDPDRDHPVRLGSTFLDEFLTGQPRKGFFHQVHIDVVEKPLAIETEKDISLSSSSSCLIVASLKDESSCSPTLDGLFDDIIRVFSSMANAGLLSLGNLLAVIPNGLADRSCHDSTYWNLIGDRFQVNRRNSTLRLGCVLLTPHRLPAKNYLPAGSGLLLKLLRDRAWVRLSVPGTPPVAFIQRKSRIGWQKPLSSDQEKLIRMREFISLVARRLRREVELVELDPRPSQRGDVDGGLRRQLVELKSLDVLISFCDVGYASSLFLRDGATAVFIGFEDHRSSCTKMDTAPHIFKTYLPLVPPEFEETLRNDRSVEVNQTLEAVEIALERIRGRDEWLAKR